MVYASVLSHTPPLTRVQRVHNVLGLHECCLPAIVTDPVTGWKSVFISNNFTKRINDVSRDESDFILAHLFKLQAQNHDLVVRFKVSQGRQ